MIVGPGLRATVNFLSSLTNYENVILMMRTAIEEAFRSVSAVSGNLARLSYLASLQKEPGIYRHWGLAREYGEEEVCAAFRLSHRLVLENMLQTDLTELAGELAMHAEDRGENKAETLQHLLDSPFVNPFQLAEHISGHINFVFEALRTLAQHSD